MADQPGGDKTLPPSPRKRSRAREQGQVPKSQDLTGAVMMLVALVAVYNLLPHAFEGILDDARHFFRDGHALAITADDTRTLALDVMLRIGRAVAPMMALLLAAGVAVNMAQVGLLLAPKAMALKLNRLNPVTGMGKFASGRTLVEFVKTVTKLVLAVWIVYAALDDRWQELLTLTSLTPIGMSKAVGAMIFAVWWRIGLAMLILGLFDYGYQRWQHEKELMMTQREAREEAKEMDGDPRIKQRIRQIQRQMAMQRMMKQVPQADVIVTNPTHYAVALRYDPATMAAPVVVAKGMRLVALRIRGLGVEHDVPIVERPELARALYKAIQVGQAVPEQLFRAVAEVLAFVYRIDRRAEKARERAQPGAARKQAV